VPQQIGSQNPGRRLGFLQPDAGEKCDGHLSSFLSRIPTVAYTKQTHQCRCRPRSLPSARGLCWPVIAAVSLRPHHPCFRSCFQLTCRTGLKKLSCAGGRPCDRCRQDGRECTEADLSERTRLTRQRMTELEQRHGLEFVLMCSHSLTRSH
jgi:hypothetical protein